jgi:RNA polymerase sigma factor (sigma-70 family)
MRYLSREQKKLLRILEADDQNFVIKQETQSELLGLIYSCIEKLPSRCRRVVQMQLQGFSYEEIAATLKVTVNTVRNQKAQGDKIAENCDFERIGPFVICYSFRHAVEYIRPQIITNQSC